MKHIAAAVALFALLVLAACGDDEPAQPEPMHDGRPISYWIDALREGSGESGLAGEALSRVGAKAVPALLEVLGHSDDYVQRIQAAGTLGNIGSGVAWEGEDADPSKRRAGDEDVVSGILSALQAVADANLVHLSGAAQTAIERIKEARVAARTAKENEGLTWEEWWEQNKNPAFFPPPWAKVAFEQMLEASKYNVPVAFENSIGMRFVLIPAGTFLMGSPEDEAGRGNWKRQGRPSNETQHRVTISQAFYMQTTEVTNAQHRHLKPDHDSATWGGPDSGSDESPVVYMSRDAAVEFAEWLSERDERRSYRLPTEAQWEYACRAGSTTAFSTGETIAADQANYNWSWVYPPEDEPRGDPFKTVRDTVTVGSYPPNAWGLYDMHGNAQEWCRDWFGDYPTEAVVDPRGPADGRRGVLRGGKWSHDPALLRSAAREDSIPKLGTNTEGFRLVSPLPEPKSGK